MPAKTRSEFMTPLEAARLLGCGQDAIKAALINGTFPVGFAFRSGTKNKPGRWHYKIPRAELLEVLKSGARKVVNNNV